MKTIDTDKKFIKKALAEAAKAYAKEEVPVGAIIVQNGKIIARAHNLRETKKSPTAHAEILAIEKAAKKLGGWRLLGCTIYVTLEPCPMCAGAIINARMTRVVFGAYDVKAGAFGSVFNLNNGGLNHTVEVLGGVLREQCAEILGQYFREKRKENKQ